MVPAADTASRLLWALEAASDVLKRQKGLGGKGPLRDAVAERLAAGSEDDIEASAPCHNSCLVH